MKFLRYAIAFVALLCLLTAHKAVAQTSVYGSAMFTNFGFTGGDYGNGSYKKNTAGLIAGAFYTFPSGSRFKAGIDGRVTYSPGYDGGSAYTGALRVGFVPNHNRLRPYFQIGGGVVSTDLREVVCNGFSCGSFSRRVTNGAAQLDFGLDIRITDNVDIRAVDYGADAGGSGSKAHAAVGFLDAGIVYHFHPTKHRNP